LRIARGDAQAVNYQCTVVDQQPDRVVGGPPAPSLLETLFGLASAPQFLESAKEYLPAPGSFAAQGHDSRETIILMDGGGKTIHTVTYSDQPEEKPPAAVTDFGQEIQRYVWEYNKERLEKACGEIPRAVQEID